MLRDSVDDPLRAIGDRLLQAAQEARAYGLAAVHIGELAPVVVISPDVEPRQFRLMFNPRIERTAPQTTSDEEGSVSLPGVRLRIERPLWADIGFMDRSAAMQTIRLEGFEARVALHEIEQMQGIFFLDRVSRLKREMALKRARRRAG